MSDVVVTVPKGLWSEWLEEGAFARHARYPTNALLR